MQRLPNHMRDMLSTRNPSDNWCRPMKRLSDSKIREIDKKLDDTKFCIGRLYALLDNTLIDKDTITGYIVGIERNMKVIREQLKD